MVLLAQSFANLNVLNYSCNMLCQAISIAVRKAKVGASQCTMKQEHCHYGDNSVGYFCADPFKLIECLETKKQRHHDSLGKKNPDDGHQVIYGLAELHDFCSKIGQHPGTRSKLSGHFCPKQGHPNRCSNRQYCHQFG